jgi:hypothetical protein
VTEQREARPRAARAGHELAADQGSSSALRVAAAPAEREALAAAVCIVCGRPDDNLSSLARCWDCIRAASDAWSAHVEAARAASTVEPAADRAADRWGDFWDRHHRLPLFLRNRPEPLRLAPPPGGPPASPRAVEARFSGLLRTVNDAPEGSRNDRLHWAACRVGEMVAAGELPDPGRAVDALAQVAAGTGLTPREIRGTIRSGLATYGVGLS